MSIENIIIIAITGNAEVDTTIEVLKLGAANFLHKPVSIELLEQTVLNSLITLFMDKTLIVYRKSFDKLLELKTSDLRNTIEKLEHRIQELEN